MLGRPLPPGIIADGKFYPGCIGDKPATNEEINARRDQLRNDKSTYILHPDEMKGADQLRAYNWAMAIIKKNEHKFVARVPNLAIVASGEVEPEEIDVRCVYDEKRFPNLRWFIHRQNKKEGAATIPVWVFALLSNNKILFKIGVLKVD